MDLRDDYQRKVQAQLNQWSAEINLLKAKAQNAEADVKINYQKKLEELKSKKDVVVRRFKKLRASGIEVFEELKESVDKACTELKQGVNLAFSHFK